VWRVRNLREGGGRAKFGSVDRAKRTSCFKGLNLTNRWYTYYELTEKCIGNISQRTHSILWTHWFLEYPNVAHVRDPLLAKRAVDRAIIGEKWAYLISSTCDISYSDHSALLLHTVLTHLSWIEQCDNVWNHQEVMHSDVILESLSLSVSLSQCENIRMEAFWRPLRVYFVVWKRQKSSPSYSFRSPPLVSQCENLIFSTCNFFMFWTCFECRIDIESTPSRPRVPAHPLRTCTDLGNSLLGCSWENKLCGECAIQKSS
jgi:hypothetical protein